MAFVGHTLLQQPVQVGAMRRDIARAVFLLRDGAQRLAKAQMRVVPGERNDFVRLAGESFERVIEIDRLQHLDAVRPDLQAGADFAKFAGALIDGDLAAELAQPRRRRQSANSCADDGDPQRPRHVHSPPNSPPFHNTASSHGLRSLRSCMTRIRDG